MAFLTIRQQKQKVDRLCVLEYDRRVGELTAVLEDHQKIAEALKSKSVDKVIAVARKHFAHLDETIEYIPLNSFRVFRAGVTRFNWGVRGAMPLEQPTKEKLQRVSTATISTALFKRGLRNQMVQDVRPLSPNQPTMVGEAFTLRYIPGAGRPESD